MSLIPERADRSYGRRARVLSDEMGMELRASVEIPIAADRAWDLWADASRWPQWQAALIRVHDVSGPASEMGSTCTLDHGPRLKRHVRVLAAERPERHSMEQTGLGLRDVTTATFEPIPGGTRVTAVVFARLNLVMRAAMLLDRGRSGREFQAELDRFAAMARLPAAPTPQIGGCYVVAAGGWRRRVTVIGLSPDRVHVRLHPGHLREKEPDDRLPDAPKPMGERDYLMPIAPPIRGAGARLPGQGLAFALRDGGHGVAHLALTLDAWTDARPREVGRDAPSEADLGAVDAWRKRGAPAVGAEQDLEMTSLWTLRLSPPDRPEVWGVAKLLRREMLRVHLALFAERWETRPERVLPGELRRPWLDEEERTGDGPPPAPGSVVIGHLPLAWNAFIDAQPRFAGIWTLEPEELTGHRLWQESSGGTFTSLDPVLDTEWGVPSAGAEVVERQTREP